MNILIIYAHPNENSFCMALKDRLIEGLKINQNPIREHNLYLEKFNPTMTKEELLNESEKAIDYNKIISYQQDITWAEKIIIIHPAWWYSTPAILKGYFDRILTNGFAFIYKVDHPEPLLLNKTGLLIQTFDGEEEMELKLYNDITYNTVFFTWKYCGIDQWERFTMFRVNFVAEKQRKEWLGKAYTIGKGIK